MSVYAISDLHGRYDFFEEVKKFLKPEDICYVLGDCGDRGPDGWKTIKAVYDDPQFIYLKGNHEDMMVQSMKDYFYYLEANEVNDFFYYSHAWRLTCNNGGRKTFEDWLKTEFPKQWIERLENLPLFITYANSSGKQIYLTHAGFTPWVGETPLDEELLWDRNHLIDDWIECPEDVYIIHGHTPTPYMDDYLYRKDRVKEFVPGARTYCRGHKINIDCGACFTGYCVLLNLDTFEEKVFSFDDELKGEWY